MNLVPARQKARVPGCTPPSELRSDKGAALASGEARGGLRPPIDGPADPRQQESMRLQYGLSTHAHDLGWPADRIMVIDDDLGKSGASAEGRVGFQCLVSEVSLDHVGIILGIEMSRLARSCKD